MGKKVMVSFLAALMIASSFSTTAFAALGNTAGAAGNKEESGKEENCIQQNNHR